jgi:glycyl-tRNA synthetase alpha chain
MYFQDLILSLQKYWGEYGCVIEQPLDLEVGAGTFHPATFFGSLGPDDWNVAYVQPSRRPTDGRYGDNPMRMGFYYQYQVILKPAPENCQELYLDSLRAAGLDLEAHDVRFTHDDWKGPTLGAAGLGWQVEMDGLEISQFTYFQQVGGYELDPVCVELTYGLERIAMALQGITDAYALQWNSSHSYGDIRLEGEKQFCAYNFEHANVQRLLQAFELYEAEAQDLIEAQLYYPAYDQVCKCSHLFNVLDARRAISVTERERYIQRIARMSKGCAKAYLDSLKSDEETEETPTTSAVAG